MRRVIFLIKIVPLHEQTSREHIRLRIHYDNTFQVRSTQLLIPKKLKTPEQDNTWKEKQEIKPNSSSLAVVAGSSGQKTEPSMRELK